MDCLTRDIASKISDPMVTKTEWLPISHSSGGSHLTHNLSETSPGRYEFRATSYFKEQCITFIVLGIFGGISLSVSSSSKGGLISGTTAIGFLICAAFIGAGWYILVNVAAPVTFDVGRGCFWKGKMGPAELGSSAKQSNVTRFKDIYALQMIASRVSKLNETPTNYYSYELNVVLNNGKRVNVMCYGLGCRNNLVTDASTLAKLIGKPVWDAVDCTIGYFESC